MANRCLNCQLPVQQVAGKRAKLYCNQKCKANYFFKQKLIAKVADTVTISKVEYEILLAAEFELKIINELEKQGETKISLVSEGFIIENKTVLDKKQDWKVNTRQRKNKVTNEAIFKPERILSDNNDGYIVSGNSIKEIEADVQQAVIAKENNKPRRLPGESTIEYKIRTATT